jgi:DNA-binding beta-propeller fold protein YncE
MSAPEQFVAFGDQRYKVIRPFASWPATLKIGIFSKGATDSKGNLYVCQRADPPVIVFDRTGNFLRSIGNGREADSHGIWITPDDRVFIVDRDAHQLLCYSPQGKLLFEIGEPARPRFNAPFSHPADVAVAPSGDIYVADGYGNSMVHRFSSDGKLKNSWGGCGAEPGQFSTPHGINVLPDGRVLVGDRENNRVQVFDPDGEFLTEWRGFYHPMDIYVDGSSWIYVTDQRPRVTALNDRGEIFGACKPALAMPHGITGDKDGNIFIIETRNIREITKLEPINS